MNRMLIAAFIVLLALPVLAQQQQDQKPRQRAGRGMMAERFTNFPNHDPKVGTEAPDFVLETLDGREVRISEFRGKSYVVLETGAYT